MEKFILLAMLILPWLTLFFIDKHSMKRFMPVAILASLLVTIVFEIAYVYDWWKVQVEIAPWDEITSVPLTYGAFLVGTIWIFHFTFDRKFWVYMLTNIFIDGLYSFVILNMLIRVGIYKLVNMGNFGIFMLMTLIAVIIYAYQKWQDSIMSSKQ
jgi:hypothetical protein